MLLHNSTHEKEVTEHMTHLIPLEGILSERGEEEPTRAAARESDWRFELLAEFEEIVRSYARKNILPR